MLKVGDKIIITHMEEDCSLKVGDITTVAEKYYLTWTKPFKVYSNNDNRQKIPTDIIIENLNNPTSQIKAGDDVKVIKTHDNRIVKTGTHLTISKVCIITEEGIRIVEDRLGGLLYTDTVVEKYEEPTSNVEPVKTTETFKKFDSEKVDYSLLEPLVVEMYCTVAQMGAKKYGRNNWKQATADDRYRYEAALLRHIMAYKSGEEIDKESGLSHLSHALWNLVAVETLRRK
jgi:hypothetical protein